MAYPTTEKKKILLMTFSEACARMAQQRPGQKTQPGGLAVMWLSGETLRCGQKDKPLWTSSQQTLHLLEMSMVQREWFWCRGEVSERPRNWFWFCHWFISWLWVNWFNIQVPALCQRIIPNDHEVYFGLWNTLIVEMYSREHSGTTGFLLNPLSKELLVSVLILIREAQKCEKRRQSTILSWIYFPWPYGYTSEF